MSNQGFGPGKTAPKLAQDFFAFDPLASNPNVLVDIPPPQGEGPQIAPHFASCKHEYTLKATQSVLPPIDQRPDGSTAYKVAVICKRCRTHAHIWLDSSHATNACPASDHPLHHFVRLRGHEASEPNRIKYTWRCSVEECSTILIVTFCKPRLDGADLKHISDPELLKARYEAVVEPDGSRDFRLAEPMDALHRLRAYVRDTCDPERRRPQIDGSNKRWQEAFGVNGQDCRELLERLGFKYADGLWLTPEPEQSLDRLKADGSSLRELLEDVTIEVQCAMYKLAADTGVENKDTAKDSLTSANADIERIMGATSYQRQSAGRRSTNNELPFYNSLGVLPDFSDSFIEYAFDRQILCDPELRAYYFECLQAITEQRQTERLQVKVATLQSQDVVSRRDLSAAYRYFNITIAESRTITDEQIRDRFQVRQTDSGSAAQEEARQHLYKIGVARQSSLLLNISRQSVETYEDALSWLGNGVTKETPDDGLLAVLTMKKDESKANEDIGLRAIATIAKERKSNRLNNFLLTGEQGSYTMNVDEALRHLNIEQKLEEVEPTLFPVLFEAARQERPGDLTERAIEAIQQALAGSSEGHAPETWPVGLVSHGNTCYLNSLLQYYFSIKPLRDIVLEYGQYKWDTAKQGQKTNRVGRAHVSMMEIEGGQRFAEDLRRLFDRMIRSRDSAVKPDADLVCRAFLKPKDYKLLDPILEEKPVDVDQPMVNGVDHVPDVKVVEDEVVASPTATLNEGGKESDASSTTLVNGSDTAMADSDRPPTPPASPGMVGSDQPKPEKAPPPLPARRYSNTKELALDRARAAAKQQQDVTEVHDSITTLLRYGMLPRGEDSEGEQEDILRDLFSIHTTQTPFTDGEFGKPTALTDSAIQLNVPYTDTDIYAALDAYFDLQPVSEGASLEAYRTIKALGPLLQISIPRIGFDNDKGVTFKTTACVRLEEQLSLDRYFDDTYPDILDRRRQSWGWRKRLQALKNELNSLKEMKVEPDLDAPTALATTTEYVIGLDDANRDLMSIDVPPLEADGDITAALTAEAEKQHRQINALESEIRALQSDIDALFAGMNRITYRLAAVFFHRGNHGHGHYWIYIHDFKNKLWRLYNDERVEKFEKLESIFAARNWDEGTPTYAVYVDESKVQEYINPVCRDPEPEPDLPPPAYVVQDDWAERYEHDTAMPALDPGVAVDPPLAKEKGSATWDDGREVAQGVACRHQPQRKRKVRFASPPVLLDELEDLESVEPMELQLASLVESIEPADEAMTLPGFERRRERDIVFGPAQQPDKEQAEMKEMAARIATTKVEGNVDASITPDAKSIYDKIMDDWWKKKEDSD